jgi:hypothetical protein
MEQFNKKKINHFSAQNHLQRKHFLHRNLVQRMFGTKKFGIKIEFLKIR